MTEQDVEAFVAELARGEHRRPPVVRWVEDSSTGQAARKRGRDVITLGRGILDDPEDACFTAAHEMGHVALGHTSGHKAGQVLAVYVGSGLALTLLAGWSAVVFLGPHSFPVATAGLLVWLLLQGALLKRLKQPQESAADVYAASHGGPLTQGLAARYEARRTRSGRVTALLFPVHPSWADRAAVVAPLVTETDGG